MIINLRKYIKSLALLIAFLWMFLSPASAFAATGTLSLSPSSGTLNTGCTYSLNIMLDTGGANTDGTDALLTYDQSRITISSVTTGKLYPDYPAHDAQNGQISISGLASPGSPYNSKSTPGVFATLNVTIPQTAPTGAFSLPFNFTKGSTTDSNVVETGTVTDILGAAPAGNYTIAQGTGTCSAITPLPSIPGSASSSGTLNGTDASDSAGIGGDTFSTPTDIPTALPKTADIQPTLVFSIAGAIFTILGLGGLAIFRK